MPVSSFPSAFLESGLVARLESERCVLMSQGMTRPGVVHGPCWGVVPAQQTSINVADMYGRPTPARRPNPALSNPEPR